MSAHETPVTWRKSSFSQGGDCVELAYSSNLILVRDSKDPFGPTLSFTVAEWASFIAEIKSAMPTAL
jgi:hypothetical protein